MRSMTELVGLRDIRTFRGTGKRVILRVQSSAHLDLYILEKERERLNREAAVLEKRSRTVQKRLEEIQVQVKSLARSVPKTKDLTPTAGKRGKQGGHPQQWKTQPLGY
jgi:tRNA(Ser,Leu) C12 N-acetylase TAN1